MCFLAAVASHVSDLTTLFHPLHLLSFPLAGAKKEYEIKKSVVGEKRATV